MSTTSRKRRLQTEEKQQLSRKIRKTSQEEIKARTLDQYLDSKMGYPLNFRDVFRGVRFPFDYYMEMTLREKHPNCFGDMICTFLSSEWVVPIDRGRRPKLITKESVRSRGHRMKRSREFSRFFSVNNRFSIHSLSMSLFRNGKFKDRHQNYLIYDSEWSRLYLSDRTAWSRI